MLRLCVTAIILYVGITQTCYASFLGVSWSGSVYRVNELNGTAVLLNSSSLSNMNSLARRDADFLTIGETFTNTLATIDPTSGNVISTQRLPANNFRALAVSPTGEIFAARNLNLSNFPPFQSELVKIDTSTNTVSSLGVLDLGLQALTFSTDGTLYGWDVGTSGFGNGLGLVTLALDGSGYSDVNPLVGTPGTEIQSIEFAPDGTLYGVRNELYGINPNTGEWTSISAQTFDWDIRGLAYIPETTITVLVDIKPGSDPNVSNPVNLKSKGVLPVAILGSEDFDVLDVDVESLLFGDPILTDNGGTPVSPLRYSFEDVTDDGFLDLSLKFSMEDLVGQEALGPDTMEGHLSGELLDGTPFEGTDSIRIVPPNGSNGNLSLIVTNVPEPTTLALVLSALCMPLRRRR